jgi:hypothetical protein
MCIHLCVNGFFSFLVPRRVSDDLIERQHARIRRKNTPVYLLFLLLLLLISSRKTKTKYYSVINIIIMHDGCARKSFSLRRPQETYACVRVRTYLPCDACTNIFSSSPFTDIIHHAYPHTDVYHKPYKSYFKCCALSHRSTVRIEGWFSATNFIITHVL